MRKTMYLAMKNLAEYIASDERDDPKEIWKDWKEKYKPLPDTVNTLKEMIKKLLSHSFFSIKYPVKVCITRF